MLDKTYQPQAIEDAIYGAWEKARAFAPGASRHDGAPPGKPYIPWADGRSPFPRAMLDSAGFQVLEFDAEDSPEARRMGHALGWDDPDGAKMDLEHDLFATYTLLRRPPHP